MKKTLPILLMLVCLAFSACRRSGNDTPLVHRVFFDDTWERFDYVSNNVEVKEETSYDLSMRISFTDAYPYDDFSMVFSVFDDAGTPYRSRGYKFKLKDAEGQWNARNADGCYTFELPINKELLITEPGTYKFQIEYRMPKTPVYGVRELSLIAN